MSPNPIHRFNEPTFTFQSDTPTPAAERPTDMGQDDFGLHVVSVTITAATPQIEHAETGFPMPPEAESQSGDVSEDQEEAVAESPTSSQSSNSPPISSPPAMPPPPAPPTVIRAKPDIVPEADAVDPNHFEANFDANFDADFDAAFDSPPPPEDNTPKQVVGGRASIPEELDSQQLERLQNLKESNA